MIRTLAAALATTTCLVALATPAAAQTREFNIPAGSLRAALDAFARQTGRQVIYRGDEVRSTQSPGVRGARTAEDALDAILAGTGFKAQKDSSGAFAVVKMGNGFAVSNHASPGAREASASGDAVGTDNTDIVVTGTHIRGAAPAGSPTTTYTRKEIEQTGAATISQFAQTMTDNFGTTSPVAAGYGTSPVGFDQTSGNSYGGASFNLHGLGQGTTLTLINGQRVSPGGSNGAFVDVSMIPLSAVEKIEVLSDGGSAVYGADAVAGVVNIDLKKDYNGAETSVRYGYPTEGGGQETTASQLIGKSWRSGNIIAVLEYDKQNDIKQSQRDFVPAVANPGSIAPTNRTWNAILSGEQRIFGDNTFIDASLTYSNRKTDLVVGRDSYIDEITSVAKQYGGSLALRHNFAGGWSASVSGNISKMDQSYEETLTIPGCCSFGNQSVTNSELEEAAFKADGPLFRLGEQSIKAAVGGGYRDERLNSLSPGSDEITLRRQVAYLYGELFVPLVSATQNIPLVNELAVSAAARYDHYNDFGSTTNEKIGATWSPVSGIKFRASYSTSFRPPLLTQLMPPPPNSQYYFQYEPDTTSPTGRTDTLINQTSNNPKLKPETAKSFTAGLDIQPELVPNLTLSLTYFRTAFGNRIASPPFIGNVFSGTANIFQQPALAPFINLSPDPAEVQAIFEGPQFYADLAGAGPGAVKAIFDAQITNIAKTVQSGLEGSVSYNIKSDAGDFGLSASATYFFQNKYLAIAGAPSVTLLNLLGEPPRFRARGGASWSRRGWGSSVFINYTNSYSNPLFTPAQKISSWTTVDWQLTYRFDDHMGLIGKSGLKVALTVQNLFDRDPPRVSAPAGTANAGFDAINASPYGRVVALQLTKSW